MQAASRQSLTTARENLARYLDGAERSDAEALGDELFAVLVLLDRERALRRHLSDVAVAATERARLLQAVVGRRVGARSMEVLTELVSSRWSQPRDLVDAVESLARQAALAVAGKDGALDETEDELFRIARLLDREPRLRGLVDDPSAPADRRAELVSSVLSGKVHGVTERLLRQAVQVPRGKGLSRASDELAELAAASRDRYVAHVSTPVALTEQQEQRLESVLSRIYARQISLQVELDRDTLGGLTIRVGDEVIDGSVASRLAAARQRLPH